MHERELLATYCIGWCIKYTLLYRVLLLPGFFVVQFLIHLQTFVKKFELIFSGRAARLLTAHNRHFLKVKKCALKLTVTCLLFAFRGFLVGE
jgi:hypothetical protein